MENIVIPIYQVELFSDGFPSLVPSSKIVHVEKKDIKMKGHMETA